MISEKENRRVLIVDDCSDTQLVFTHIFEGLGAEVTTAQDGETGVNTVVCSLREGRPFHLVILDIRMPRVDGIEAASRLRCIGYRGIIAMCTANPCYSEDQQRENEIFFDKRMASKRFFSSLLDYHSKKSAE